MHGSEVAQETYPDFLVRHASLFQVHPNALPCNAVREMQGNILKQHLKFKAEHLRAAHYYYYDDYHYNYYYRG